MLSKNVHKQVVPMDFSFNHPTLDVCDMIYKSKLNSSGARECLQNIIIDRCMPGLYRHLSERGVLRMDRDILDKLVREKQKAITDLEAERKDELENESRVFSIDKRICEIHAQAMDVSEAVDGMQRLMLADASLSLKMDIFLCRIRMGMIVADQDLLEKSMFLADEVCESGCEWDRRNKYKVHKGVVCIMRGRFSEAAKLLSEALPSFASPEVVSCERVVTYLVFCGLLAFSRCDVRSKIVECPDVVLSMCVDGLSLARCLLECKYGEFLCCLCKFCVSVKEDVFLQRFVNFFCLEMRLRVYKQILECYKSMSVARMAGVFGVSCEYIEKDLYEFISDGRMCCKIDKVCGTVQMESEGAEEVFEVISRGMNVMRRVSREIK